MMYSLKMVTNTNSNNLNKMKMCSKCGEIKPLNHFGKDSSTNDNKMKKCKVCVNSRQNEYNKLPSVKSKRKEYNSNELNKQRQKEYHKQWYQMSKTQ